MSPKSRPARQQLLVFADAHQNPAPMLDTLARYPGATAAFFLGDGEYGLATVEAAFPRLPFYVVQGNCDLASDAPLEGLAPFGGILFFYTHGHTLGVKQGLDRLWEAARRAGADAALFGHTHAPYSESRRGIRLFNPGSISRPRSGGPTYGLITIRDGTAHYEILPYTP